MSDVYLLVFVVIAFYFIYIYQMMGELQLSGYSISYPFIYIFRLFINKVLYFIFSLALTIFFAIVFNKNLYIMYLFFLIQFFLSIYIFFDRKKIKGLKKTKRLLRLNLVSFLLYAFLLFSLIYISSTWLFFLINFIALLLSPFVLVLSLFVLSPIEKLINFYFISKAKEILKHCNMVKIGITGSFGKTSVKEILVSILRRKYSVLSTPKSFNTPLGITRTINENYSNTNEVFVCEMGAKKKGEIDDLCKMVDVDLGIVTSVGRQHTLTFGSIENIYKTKYELPNYLNGKTCIFNLMNRFTSKMFFAYSNSVGVYVSMEHNIDVGCNIKAVKLYTCVNFKYAKLKFFEYPRYNVFSARSIKMSECGSSFDVYKNSNFLFKANISLIGIHNIINSMLAIAMAHILNVDNVNISYGIRDIMKIEARCEVRKSYNGGVVINNGYNSNIDSVDYLLKSLALFKKENVVIVTPGLIESEDDFMYNKLFGEKIAKYATSIVIVKDKNKKAILEGLKKVNFNMGKVRCVSSFDDISNEINNCNSDFLYLIENDLPNNFK